MIGIELVFETIGLLFVDIFQTADFSKRLSAVSNQLSASVVV